LVVNPEWRLSAPAALKHAWMVNKDASPGGPAFSRDVANALRDYGSASHFQRVVLTMLAWHLDTEDRKALGEIFLKIDKDKVGEVSLKTLAGVLQKEFHLDSEEIKRTLKAIDVNCSHSLDYTEFLAAMLKTRVCLHEDLLKIGFDRMDCTNTGYLTIDDLRQALGDQFTDDDLAQIMTQLDKDGDHKVSFEEFCQAIHAEQNTALLEKTGRAIDSIIANDENERAEKSVEGDTSPIRRKEDGEIHSKRNSQGGRFSQAGDQPDDPFGMQDVGAALDQAAAQNGDKSPKRKADDHPGSPKKAKSKESNTGYPK